MAKAYSSPSERWLALQHRDPGANSSFLYGVVSTRIYCRPTCPGRLARRSNVIFFDTLDHAHRANYRPCIRCQPCNDAWDRDSQGRVIVGDAQSIIVGAVLRREAWTVEGVARELGISGGHLHRLFKKHISVTPKAYAATFDKSSRSSSPHQALQSFPPPRMLVADANMDTWGQIEWPDLAFATGGTSWSINDEL